MNITCLICFKSQYSDREIWTMQKYMSQISEKYLAKIFHESHPQKCYPRTYKAELAEDIFRIYDMDNNGSVDFQVGSTKKWTFLQCILQEFLVIGTIISGGSNEEKLKQIFRWEGIFQRCEWAAWSKCLSVYFAGTRQPLKTKTPNWPVICCRPDLEFRIIGPFRLDEPTMKQKYFA